MYGWVGGAAVDDRAPIDPPPDAAIAAPACLIVKNVPWRLMLITRSHSDVGVAITGPIVPVPADATAMCRPPVNRFASATAAATSSSTATSPANTCTPAPAAASEDSEDAAAANRSAVRPINTT